LVFTSANGALFKNQSLSPAEVAKPQDPNVTAATPVEAARLIGRNAIIKTKNLKWRGMG